MKTLLASLALLVLLAAPALQAQPGDMPGKGPGPFGHLNLKELRSKLKLTDDQVKALGEVRQTTQKKMIDVRGAIAKKQIDMKALMAKDAPSRADVEKLTREIADLRIEQRMLMFDAEQSAMKQLTPEQQRLWKEMRAERIEHARGQMQGRGPMQGRGNMRAGRGMRGTPPPADDAPDGAPHSGD